MLKVNSGTFIGAKSTRIWNKRCREIFYAQCNFSQGISCDVVSYLGKIWLILIRCSYQAADWTAKETWFDFSIGKGVLPFHNLHTSYRANPAAY